MLFNRRLCRHLPAPRFGFIHLGEITQRILALGVTMPCEHRSRVDSPIAAALLRRATAPDPVVDRWK